MRNGYGTLTIVAEYTPDGQVCSLACQDTQADGGRDGPTEEANARLIAAAPELLAALRNIADVATKLAEQSGSAQACFIREEALAAIAKATQS